jgi:hypothetical protein
LNPSSPLIPTLSLPVNFSIEHTPLVTFRRIDLLLNKTELIDLHKEIYNPPDNFELFSKEQFWSLSPKEYMPMFLAPLPEANYGTIIASTGGHWTTTVLRGLRDESKKDTGYGIEGVLEFFNHAMKKWATDVQEALHADQRNGNGGRKTPRRVVVRAYLPGHEDCHNIYEPWTYWHNPKWNWYNWTWIKDFNKIFQVRGLPDVLDFETHLVRGQGVLSSPAFPDVFYLPIDNPALLRPDAVSVLCLCRVLSFDEALSL